MFFVLLVFVRKCFLKIRKYIVVFLNDFCEILCNIFYVNVFWGRSFFFLLDGFLLNVKDFIRY